MEQQEDLRRIGVAIREEREKRGLTQKGAARLVGISNNTMSKLESGETVSPHPPPQGGLRLPRFVNGKELGLVARPDCAVGSDHVRPGLPFPASWRMVASVPPHSSAACGGVLGERYAILIILSV